MPLKAQICTKCGLNVIECSVTRSQSSDARSLLKVVVVELHEQVGRSNAVI